MYSLLFDIQPLACWWLISYLTNFEHEVPMKGMPVHVAAGQVRTLHEW